MNKITKLPQNLINKIAAGEVVERPASIVKELFENSIDAGADKITLKLIEGGLKEITVTDNGSGIPEEDIENAFTQHATSKIKELDDLSNILTLGFRGEALASIAAVADVEIHTFSKESKPTMATFSNSQLKEKQDFARDKGTTISIFDVFRHVPARKKFLSSEYTEYKHIQNIFTALALSHPEIHFELLKEGRVIHNLPKATPLERIKAIYPDHFSEEPVKISYDSPDIKLSGYIGHPSDAGNKPLQYTFLNKRPITEKTVFAAVRDGYNTTIPRDRKPTFFINISIDPKKVDVNVHPRKSEVKFEDSRSIYKSVKQAVQKALETSLQENLRSTFKSTDEYLIPVNVSRDKNNQRSYDQAPKMSVRRPSNNKALIQESLSFTEKLLSHDTEEGEYLDAPNNLPPTDLHPTPYNYIGQIMKTFLIFEKEDTLIILDQHAADERVNYEKLEERYKEGKNIETQTLMVPYTFDVPGENNDHLKALQDDLSKLGVDITPMSGDTFQLSSVPAFMKSNDFKKFIDSILDDIEDSSGTKLRSEQVLNKLISTIACHSSIRAGDIIEKSQALKIITDLHKCKLPYACPHGRPIIWKQTKQELSKNFERH